MGIKEFILKVKSTRISLLARGNLSSANSLDPDQDQQNVGPESKLFDTLIVFLKEFFEKVEKNSQQRTITA